MADPRIPASRPDLARLAGVHPERFLAEQVLPVGDSRHGGFVVQRVGRADEDQIDAGVLDHLAPVFRDELGPVLPGCRLETVTPPSAQRHDAGVLRRTANLGTVGSADESRRTDHSDSKLHRGSCS